MRRKGNPKLTHIAFYIMFTSFIIVCAFILHQIYNWTPSSTVDPKEFMMFQALLFGVVWAIMMTSIFVFLDNVRVVK